MALLQGAQMPDVTTSQTQSTSTPTWYTDYLQNTAAQGQNAAQNAQFAGITPQQQQSYDLASANVGNYKPTLDMATGYLGKVGNYDVTTAGAGALQSALSQNATGAASPYLQKGANADILGTAQPYLNSAANPTYNTVQNYMNPYTQSVVSQIGDLAQQNIMNNVAPQTTAGIVGSGQFGSQRGASALANTLGQYGQQTTAAQTGALQKGYSDAMAQAQAQAALQGQLAQVAGGFAQNQAANQLSAGSTLGQLTNQQQSNLANIGNIQGNQASQQMQNLINAAQTGGQLATTTQNLGLGDVNALNTLGTQQQQIQQAQNLFPLQMAQSQAGLLQGAQIPTSSTSTYNGPIPGAYQNSPLSTGLGSAASLGALLGGSNYTGSGLLGLLGLGQGATYTNPSDATMNAVNSSNDPIAALIAAQGGGSGGAQ